MDVTVVVPAYGRADLLAECLAAQGKRYPVVVVDDADPLVAAVAPRVRGVAPSTWVGRYTVACCALDLGERPAAVAPGRAVSYVPTAALLVRRAALREIGVFDPALRVGEDVDLMWRLHEFGWRIRYVPTVSVGHHEPKTWHALLARRFRYGTSAGPLALRHPKNLAPLVAPRLVAAGVIALLAGRPRLAVLLLAGHTTTAIRAMRTAGLPLDLAGRTALTAIPKTWLGIGRYGTQFAAPLLALSVGSRTRRIAAASLLLGPPLADWIVRKPKLDPARYALGHIADDIAYGLGVVTSSLRSRTLAPLSPLLT
jgi:mycofactocin system glycosyltransferase